MASDKIKYTSSKAIDHFNAGATMMRITGYVDSIEGLKALPNSNSKWIYKCIVNNNDNRRVRLIFWGDDAVKYSKEIQMYQVLKITGGVIKQANPTYRKSGDTVGKMEFQYGSASTFEVLGIFSVANGTATGNQSELNYECIPMKEVSAARGPVIVSGWIKELFRNVSVNNGSSYGSAMICTDVHRMSVHVAQFIPNVDLKLGVKVTIRGVIERRTDAFILNVTSMNQIEIVPGAVEMTEDEMDDAVESPPLFIKRDAPESPEPNAAKKLKID